MVADISKSDEKDKRVKVILGDDSVVHVGGSPEYQMSPITKTKAEKGFTIYVIRRMKTGMT